MPQKRIINLSPNTKNRSSSELSDVELLNQYQQTADMSCFALLYKRYLPLVYGVCLKYLQDEARAQDATMDIFEKLLPKLGSYHIKEFRTWLYEVVKNHCFALLKERKRSVSIEFDSTLMESDLILTLLSEETPPDAQDALTFCLEQLPDVQRISVELFFYKEQSYADIVIETGYQLKSVKSYIQNGKRNLKNCIEKRLENI